MPPLGNKVGTFAQMLIRPGTPHGGHVHQRETDLGAHARIVGHLGGDFREEIHVGKSGGASANHFCHGQSCAIGHELLADKPGFGGPDMFVQPGHQGQVICHTPEQGHGCVSVQVDQPGQYHMLIQTDGFPGAKLLVGFGLGHNSRDATALQYNGLVLQHDTKRFNGNQPAGIDSDIGCGDGICSHLPALRVGGAESLCREIQLGSITSRHRQNYPGNGANGGINRQVKRYTAFFLDRKRSCLWRIPLTTDLWGPWPCAGTATSWNYWTSDCCPLTSTGSLLKAPLLWLSVLRIWWCVVRRLSVSVLPTEWHWQPAMPALGTGRRKSGKPLMSWRNPGPLR